MTRLGSPVLVGCAVMAVGLVLTGLGYSGLSSSDSIRTDRNPFAFQKSAYGKLMARLSETTIDRVWHLGIERIVPHLITPEELEHDHDHAEDHSHEDEAAEDEFVYHVDGEEGAGEASKAKSSKTPVERAKLWLSEMRYAKYNRSNNNGFSEAHLAEVKRDVEALLLRSYKMDPLHYGAYNSYHLFLTTHEYGGNEAKKQKARLIAELTIQEALKETEDAEPYLTAVAAAYNLFHMDANVHRAAGTRMELGQLQRHQNNIAFLLARFEKLQENLQEDGTWQNLSFERQMEINERYRFASRSFDQFDAMLSRLARPETTIEEDVAGLLEFDGL